ncbi:Pre-mRNA-splicing factor sap61 [Vermiconidia calcicola]|uniref:Pre-mRNA-splicing factor sap61 n=1 Tax=Vermiconidia calcicola TaxID=1690605 RepID=A0ACC3MLM7_9PEZI|nr:Pre-mRNA-splicing factor sap61 [Vermiconidia calcicola]
MIHEDLRFLHEDIERLESAISDRVLEEPKHVRNRLNRDHEIAAFLSRIQSQSERGLQIYNNEQEARTQEVQAISTGDQFEEFYKRLDEVKSFHKRNPNEPVENLERAYKRVEDGGSGGFAGDIDGMFTGEESFGRFFDLTMLHEEFLNLPAMKAGRKLTYLQYLDIFDVFTPPRCSIPKQEKLTDQYFTYVGSLSQYLESFIRRTKPLEDLEKLFKDFDDEFEKSWEQNEVPGWEKNAPQSNGGASRGPVTEGTGEGVWCADCEKEFKNENVYRAHLTGKKHIKNAEARQGQKDDSGDMEVGNTTSAPTTSTARLKEKAIAEREHQIRKLAATMQTEREDTRVNVERKAGMTDRERQQELAALYAEDEAAINAAGVNGDDEDDSDEKIYNPLKLPLAWDGKPIPFWLYKLHGLGVEFPCEICGNYVYMGRRAFEKHFSEARHVHGLKCLGITNTALFREITQIEEAQRLWEKIQRDRKKVQERKEDVVEMEDTAGNVMPVKVYQDLEKMGML